MLKNVFVALLAVSAVIGSPLLGLGSSSSEESLSSPLPPITGLAGASPYQNYLAGVTTLGQIFPTVAKATNPLAGITTKLGGVLSATDLININTISTYIVNQSGLPLSSQPGIVAFITQILYLIDYGVTLNFANGQLTLGGVSLPSYLTCQTFGTSLAACQICNYDCVYVHNTYGGKCAKDTSTPLTNTTGAKGYDCVCQTERNANGTITPVQDVCGSIAGPAFDAATSVAILQFLWVREQAELCIPSGNNTFIGAGCNADCPRNHQYQSGTCEVVPTIPFTAAQSTTTDNGSAPYCICSFAGTNTTTVPVSSNPALNAPSRK